MGVGELNEGVNSFFIFILTDFITGGGGGGGGGGGRELNEGVNSFFIFILTDFITCRLTETTISKSRDLFLSDVSKGIPFSCCPGFCSVFKICDRRETATYALPRIATIHTEQKTPLLHSYPRNWRAVRRKWIKFMQFKRRCWLRPARTYFCVVTISSIANSRIL